MYKDSKYRDLRAHWVAAKRTRSFGYAKWPALQNDLACCADLAPLYQYLCSELGWTLDSTKLAEMQAANAAKLTELDAKQKDAEENLGETEVRDVMLARAEYLGSIGDREAAAQAFDAVEKKTASGGNKVDLLFSQIR